MRRDHEYYGPPIPVVVDRFRREKSKSGGTYWRFNVFIAEPGRELLSLGWRYQNGKIAPPFTLIGNKFYTLVRVGRATARAIYQEVIRRVGEIEGTVIPFSEKGWKSPIIGESSIMKSLPEYYFEKFGKQPVEDYDPDEEENYPAEDAVPAPPPAPAELPRIRFARDWEAEHKAFEEKHKKERPTGMPPGCPPGKEMTWEELVGKWEAYEAFMDA
jgi:hypothetical protein